MDGFRCKEGDDMWNDGKNISEGAKGGKGEPYLKTQQ